MAKFNFHSIGFRVGAVIGTLLVALMGPLLVFNMNEEMKLEIDAEIKSARNLILMAESVRENMEQKWDMGLFSPEMMRNIPYKNEEDR